MSYSKITIISGYISRRPNGHRQMSFEQMYDWHKSAYVSTARFGHWSKDAATRMADKMGLKYGREMSHSTNDLSGRGRGGEDATFKI